MHTGVYLVLLRAFGSHISSLSRYNHAWPSWLYIGPIVAFAVCYNLPKFFELSAIVDEGETYRLAFLVRK